MSYIPIILSILILLMISAFFSASETAFLSLSKAQVRRLQNGSGRERIVHRLLKDSQRMLGTVLLGNLFVNTLLTVLTATLMSRLVASTLVSSILSIAVVAPILILGGELIPKIRGLRHNLSIALFAAPILLFLSYPLAPILWVLNGISIAVLKLLGFYSEGASWEALTNGELLATFDSAESTGAATSREHDLLERILRFGTIQAREIMLPRMQIVGIEDTTTLDEAFRIARKSDFSALPVFHENLDDVWCVLSFDRILRFRNTPLGARPLSSFRKAFEGEKTKDGVELPVSPIEFVPGTANIEKLLQTMRSRALRVCIVVSEYGGTQGMVTRSMILEEIVGRYAFSGRDFNRLLKHNGGYLADGRARLRMVEDELECEFDVEAETLAGFVMEMLGRIPAPGDSFEEQGYRFQVVRTAGRLASAVLINKLQPEGKEEE